MFDFLLYNRAFRDREAYDLDNNPTLYNIAKMYVKYENDTVTMKEIVNRFRKYLFDDYYLDMNVSRETFEENIIIHFFNRRIEYDTFSFFRLKFNQVLKDILLKYNALFSILLKGTDIFNDTTTTAFNSRKENNGGYTTDTNGSGNITEHKDTSDNDTKTLNSNTVDDKRHSDTPQDRLSDVRDGSYVSEYNYDQSTATGTENNTHTGNETAATNTSETGKETNSHNDTDIITNIENITNTNNLIDKYEKMQGFQNIMTMIYNDLEICFLQTD